MSKETPGVRYAEISRETTETRIEVVLDLDGGTRRDISSGIGFLDHMLSLFAFHGQLDIGLTVEGDLEVDDHHSAEDVGIVIGMAIAQAVDQSTAIERYASVTVPMDEALVMVAIDFSGRSGLYYDVQFTREKIGDLSTECVREFFNALCRHCGITLHIRQLAGENNHHICEAMFKGFGLALRSAATKSERRGSSSTKGLRD